MISIDIAGQRYGRLVAVRLVPRQSRERYWLFTCDCGNQKEAKQASVRSGLIASCGCLQQEARISNNTKHGGNGTRLYSIWKGMHARCNQSTRHSFNRYGGRGIHVCAEWSEFAPFRDWAMANGYSDDLTIDRIDVDGNYQPGNCRWATWEVQFKNRG
jgi:hypothetical protein